MTMESRVNDLDARVRLLESTIATQEERSKGAAKQRAAVIDSVARLEKKFDDGYQELVKSASESSKKLAVQETRIKELMGMHKNIAWKERGLIAGAGTGLGAMVIELISRLAI